MEKSILNGPAYLEAQKKAIAFLMDEKFLTALPGAENRSARESLRICRRNLTEGRKPGPRVVLNIMSLMGYGIEFKKSEIKV